MFYAFEVSAPIGAEVDVWFEEAMLEDALCRIIALFVPNFPHLKDGIKSSIEYCTSHQLLDEDKIYTAEVMSVPR